MPVETAADRAAFFNPDEFAERAAYTAPGGSSVPCTLIVDRGQGRKAMDLGKNRAVGPDRLVQVLAEGAGTDDAPGITPARGGRFDIPATDLSPAEVLEIPGMPMLDETGVWWTAEVVQVAV